jgi:hypothetical protein
MPRDGAITFRDIVGKLAILRVTRDKCGRSGQYHVDRLIMRYRIDAKLFDWSARSRPTARGSTSSTKVDSAAHGWPIQTLNLASNTQIRCFGEVPGVGEW